MRQRRILSTSEAPVRAALGIINQKLWHRVIDNCLHRGRGIDSANQARIITMSCLDIGLKTPQKLRQPQIAPAIDPAPPNGQIWRFGAIPMMQVCVEQAKKIDNNLKKMNSTSYTTQERRSPGLRAAKSNMTSKKCSMQIRRGLIKTEQSEGLIEKNQQIMEDEFRRTLLFKSLNVLNDLEKTETLQDLKMKRVTKLKQKLRQNGGINYDYDGELIKRGSVHPNSKIIELKGRVTNKTKIKRPVRRTEHFFIENNSFKYKQMQARAVNKSLVQDIQVQKIGLEKPDNRTNTEESYMEERQSVNRDNTSQIQRMSLSNFKDYLRKNSFVSFASTFASEKLSHSLSIVSKNNN